MSWIQIPLRGDLMVDEVRRIVFDQLVARGIMSVGDDFRRVRLRQRVAGANPQATYILREGTVVENVTCLTEYMEFLAQILDAPEELLKRTGNVVWVRRWHRRTRSLGPRFETALPPDESAADMVARLARLAGVDVADPATLRLAAVLYWGVEPIKQINLEKIPWINFSPETRPIKTAKAEWYLTADNVLNQLVVTDMNEPLRELTEEEQALTAPGFTFTPTTTATTVKTEYVKPKEKGVTIGRKPEAKKKV